MLQSIFSTILGVIIPISIPVLCGVVLTKFRNLQTKPLLTVALYIMSPAIIFKTLLNAQVSMGDFYSVLAFTLLNVFLLWLTAKITARAFRLNEAETAGLTLVSTLTNCVNYGLPLILLAFGEAGLARASVYVVLMMIITHTVGIYFAARSQFSGKNAVKSVFSLPAAYAALAAIILRVTGFEFPSGVMKGITLLSNGYSPVVLIILGAQMVGVKTSGLARDGRIAFTAGMLLRMVASPLIALLLLFVLRIDGLLRSVLFIEAALPVAINAVILAERFDAAEKTVSNTILWSTLLSFAVLPFLIVWVAG